MPSVSLRHKHESFESLMRRFKKAVEKADIIREIHDREAYEKPCEKRKRAKAAAVKRTHREQSMNNLPRKRPFAKKVKPETEE